MMRAKQFTLHTLKYRKWWLGDAGTWSFLAWVSWRAGVERLTFVFSPKQFMSVGSWLPSARLSRS